MYVRQKRSKQFKKELNALRLRPRSKGVEPSGHSLSYTLTVLHSYRITVLHSYRLTVLLSHPLTVSLSHFLTVSLSNCLTFLRLS